MRDSRQFRAQYIFPGFFMGRGEEVHTSKPGNVGMIGKCRRQRLLQGYSPCTEIVDPTIITLYRFKPFAIPSGSPFLLLGGGGERRGMRAHPLCLQACLSRQIWRVFNRDQLVLGFDLYLLLKLRCWTSRSSCSGSGSKNPWRCC